MKRITLKRSLLSLSVTVALAAGSMSVQADNDDFDDDDHRHRQNGKFLITWNGDQMMDGNNHSPLDAVLGLPAGVLPDADFIAVIDADPRSHTYGHVVNTANMPAVYGQHLLSSTDDFVDQALDIALCVGKDTTEGVDGATHTGVSLSTALEIPPVVTPEGEEPVCVNGSLSSHDGTSIGLSGLGRETQVGDILGGVPNFNNEYFGGPGNGLPPVVPAPSSVLNEPHHHSVYPYVDPDTGAVNAYYGSLISSNVFGCDITDPMNITASEGSTVDNIFGDANNQCGLSVSGRSDAGVGNGLGMDFSGLDDLEYNSVDGKYYTTMMGAGGNFNGAYSASSTSASSLPPVLTTPGGLIVFSPNGDPLVQVPAVPDLTKFGATSPSVMGHGYFADGSDMLGPERYAPRVQLGFGGVDGNGECAGAQLASGAGVNVFNLCVPGVAPHNQIGADSGHSDPGNWESNEGPDTGLLAHPHGIGLRPDLVGQIHDADGNFLMETMGGVLMTSDYADPVSLALTGSGEGAASSKQNLGTTIRLWDMGQIENGPYQVIQMPDGNRHEDNAIHEEPEGLMAMRMEHKGPGAYVASMCGGIIYYSADITVPQPEFKIVYDFGACTGASVFTITQNDKFMFVPISGIQQAGDPIHNRDYDGEHDGRIAVLDLRKLRYAGASHGCDMSPESAWDYDASKPTPLGQAETTGPSGEIYRNRGDLFHGTVYHPNNGNSDCPDQIDMVNFAGAGEPGIEGSEHPDAETSRGGPHFTTHDRNDRYVATSNYFVDLREFAIRDVDVLLTAMGLGHAWDNGSGGTIPNAYPPGGPGADETAPWGLGIVHDVLNAANDGDAFGGAFTGQLPGFEGGHKNALPGTGSVGDDTVCMMKWNRKRTNLKLDTRFNAGDANSPTGCIDMDFGDTGAQWPTAGARHPDAGNASPHGMSFVKVGANRFFTNGNPDLN